MTLETFECYPVKLRAWNSKATNWLFPGAARPAAVLQQPSLYPR